MYCNFVFHEPVGYLSYSVQADKTKKTSYKLHLDGFIALEEH